MSQWAGWGLRPLDLPIGVGGFGFIVVVFLLRLIVAFHGCSPSIHDDVREFFGDFWVGRKRGSILYSPNYFKNCILRLRLPALRSLSTRGYTNPKKISLVTKNSCTSHNTEGVLISNYF